jgi:hypothetical protein
VAFSSRKSHLEHSLLGLVHSGFGLEDREFSSLCGPPEAHHSRNRNNPFTAADEKIPLSVVYVNNKPQYIVFSLHSLHLVRKHPHLPVESSIAPSAARS